MSREEIDKMFEDTNIRNCCCPICGYEFDEVKEEGNVCPTSHYGRQVFSKDQLIGTWDDYEWCQ